MVSPFAGCGLERTDFNSFYTGMVWCFLLSQLVDLAEWITLINFKKLNHSYASGYFSLCLITSTLEFLKNRTDF